MDPKSDAQLLGEYAEKADDAVFAEVFTRDTDLVTAVHDMVGQLKPLLSRITSQDWINYDQRSIMFGEQNAI